MIQNHCGWLYSFPTTQLQEAPYTVLLNGKAIQSADLLNLELRSHVPTWFSSAQSLSPVQLFATPWIAARKASLSITNSRGSLRLTSIESVIPSSHLILCRPLLLLPPTPPSIRIFSNEPTLHMRWPKYWVSALASFLPKKSWGWSPSEWTDWISLQSKGLLRVFSNTTVQKHHGTLVWLARPDAMAYFLMSSFYHLDSIIMNMGNRQTLGRFCECTNSADFQLSKHSWDSLMWVIHRERGLL